MIGLDAQPFERYLELEEQERQLKEALKIVSKEKDTMEPVLAEQMALAGMRSFKMADGTTVFLHRKTFPKMRDGVDRGRVIKALLESGFGTLVQPNYNGNQLNALVSEFAKGGKAMPEPLANVLDISEKIEVRVRRTGSGESESSEGQQEN